jgi:hypothetical protein
MAREISAPILLVVFPLELLETASELGERFIFQQRGWHRCRDLLAGHIKTPGCKTVEPVKEDAEEWVHSADDDGFHVKKAAEFLYFIGDIPDADGAVVSGALGIPALDECACADGEPVAAVRVADFEDRAGN